MKPVTSPFAQLQLEKARTEVRAIRANRRRGKHKTKRPTGLEPRWPK